MTDIYDFRDEVFKTYKNEWSVIYKAIRKYTEVKQNVLFTDECYKILKKHSLCLWDKCPDDIIYDFIVRATQINYYELIYLPSKK